MKVFDLHNDFPTRTVSGADRDAIYQSYEKEAMRVVSVFFTTRTIHPFSFMDEYLARYTPSSARAFAVEDLHFLQDDKDIERLIKLPLLYAGLTWNGANALAGGVGSPDTLSDFGKRVVRVLSASPIAVDTAHLNEASFYAVSEATEVLINSHTCLKSICAHERNLSDEQIKLILARGGIIGITAVAQFMGKPEGKGTRADVVRQIDTFLQRFGIKGLCIGTDFNGTDPVEGLSCYGDFSALAYDLEQCGYQKSDIERIFYRNASDFFLSRASLK